MIANHTHISTVVCSKLQEFATANDEYDGQVYMSSGSK